MKPSAVSVVLMLVIASVSVAGYTANFNHSANNYAFNGLCKRMTSRCPRRSGAMKAYDVRTLRPCGSGGIIVEGHFGREFSMHELCSLLQGVATCSEKLGVARFSHEGYNITIYRKGRVDVHGVASEEEAIACINDIKVVVEAAFVETNVDELITALRDEHSKVRQKAADSLGEEADRRAAEPLAHALADSDADVRLSAAFALGMIGDASGTAPLKFALKNEKDKAVRGALETALNMIEKNVRSKKCEFSKAFAFALTHASLRPKVLAPFVPYP